MAQNVCAVITGDLVRSRLYSTRRADVLDWLQSILRKAAGREERHRGGVLFSRIFRGDSFQGLVIHPERALRIILYIRSELLQIRIGRHQAEVRLGLGIGRVGNLKRTHIEASDGEAFRLSGRALDTLKGSRQKYRRFSFISEQEDMNPGLALLAAALDAVIQSWSIEQAEAVSHWLQGKTQAEISRALRIRQPAVQQRLRLAGHFALGAALEYYDSLFMR